jgi:Arc/MetJ-type ribon-helix-helix transcriptional regulator
MVNTSIQNGSRKITVTLPQAVLARLRAHVPARQRSRFILEAIEERLELEEQIAALDETAGAWSDQHHPEMRTEEDIDCWLSNLRRSWSKQES